MIGTYIGKIPRRPSWSTEVITEDITFDIQRWTRKRMNNVCSIYYKFNMSKFWNYNFFIYFQHS